MPHARSRCTWKNLPWPFSTGATSQNADGFQGCHSPHPVAADFIYSLLDGICHEAPLRCRQREPAVLELRTIEEQLFRPNHDVRRHWHQNEKPWDGKDHTNPDNPRQPIVVRVSLTRRQTSHCKNRGPRRNDQDHHVRFAWILLAVKWQEVRSGGVLHHVAGQRCKNEVRIREQCDVCRNSKR